MITTQILLRPFFGKTIRQNHKTTYLNANDIFEIGNSYRKNLKLPKADMRKYIEAKKTQEFLHSLMIREQLAEPIIRTKGRGVGTWVHPFVALDMLMWLNPDFKVEAIKMIYNSICVFRDKSGDSYKELASIINDKSNLPPAQVGMKISYVAKKIKRFIQVEDWNTASDKQLELRDKIHRDITLLIKAGIDIEKAFDIVIDDIKIN